MILDQKLDIDNDKYHLETTFDIGTAKELNKEATDAGGERTSTMRCMGHIPPEMWSYEPHLILANRAFAEGDAGEAYKQMCNFFNTYPALAIKDTKRVYSVGGV